MVEELAKDYASYFSDSKITDHQVEPIMNSIEQILIRLDEFESILSTVNQNAATSVQQHLPAVLERQLELLKMCRQIDSLENFVEVAERNVARIEQSVNRADEDLGVNSLGIKGLILRGKKWATEAAVGVGGVVPPVGHGEFEAPEVFNTGDFFVASVVD